MITLHTLRGRFGLESLSPFCMKAEVYLKLTKLEYRALPSDPRKAPKKKLPMIDDDGKIVCDSSAIIEYLEKKSDKPLDLGLSQLDRARARMIQRTFEEGFYFVALWSRWVDDEGWALSKTILSDIPAAVRWAILPMVRRQMSGYTQAQGTGRHSREEIFEMGVQDLRALGTLLGDSPFVLGDKPRTIDCTVYSFLANILLAPVENPLKDYVKSQPKLEGYVKRMQDATTAS